MYPKYELEKTNDSKSRPIIKMKIPISTATRVLRTNVVMKKASMTIASPNKKKLTMCTPAFVCVNAWNWKMYPHIVEKSEFTITSRVYDDK
jgi:hypothetical protein